MAKRCVEMKFVGTMEQLDELLDAQVRTKSGKVDECRAGASVGEYPGASDGHPGTGDERIRKKKPINMIVPMSSQGGFMLMMKPAGVGERPLLTFPAGHINYGEGSFMAGAGELLRNYGLKAGKIQPLGWHCRDVGETRESVDVFLARHCDLLEEPKIKKPMVYYRVDGYLLMEMLKAGYIRDADAYVAVVKAGLLWGMLC